MSNLPKIRFEPPPLYSKEELDEWAVLNGYDGILEIDNILQHNIRKLKRELYYSQPKDQDEHDMDEYIVVREHLTDGGFSYKLVLGSSFDRVEYIIFKPPVLSIDIWNNGWRRIGKPAPISELPYDTDRSAFSDDEEYGRFLIESIPLNYAKSRGLYYEGWVLDRELRRNGVEPNEHSLYRYSPTYLNMTEEERCKVFGFSFVKKTDND
jgi:hypothetical protein